MKVAGAIILGGNNSRMGGEKKAFLEFKGKKFYELIASSMEDLEKTYFSVEDASLYKETIYEKVEDIYKNIGPMGGLHSLLKNCPEDAILILPSDIPLITKEIVNKIADIYYTTGGPVVLKDNNNYLNPLIALYTKNCFPIVENLIYEDNFKMSSIFERIEHEVLNFNDLQLDPILIENINDKSSYIKLLTR